MKGSEAIPRTTLLWLLVAQVLVIIPHLSHLPLWIIGLWLACTYWRVQIFRMRALYPKAWVKILMMVATGFAVYFSRGGLLGLEAGAVLMIAAFILKVVEMRRRRDALVVILLGFFAVVISYLFQDSIFAALYSLLPVTALLAAMIGLQPGSGNNGAMAGLRQAGSLLGQALPLMLVLFVLFPRLGPLWGLPQPTGEGYSGLAESIAPGDIARLSRSGELAFRATFDGAVPSRDALYWRAVTFDVFDGRRWTRSANATVPRAAQWEPRGEPVSYSIILQPTGQHWLMSLDVPQLKYAHARLMGDFHLETRRPITQPHLYHLQSWPDALREPEAAPPSLQYALQLPEQGNPRARAWAQELSQREGDPERVVQAMLRHFNQEPYRYTLKPPPVGADIVDGFLFDTQAGFCSHYAGAMVFALRAAGIPARVVGGYQGGELNPSGNYLTVRQFDAHAWVEYWLAGRGWVSVDPTFEVAPERILEGLEQAVAQEESFLEESPFSPLRYRDIGWLNDVRLAWDSLNYGWERWILGYQGGEQQQLLAKLFGEIGLRGLGLLLIGVVAALLLTLAVWMFRPWRRQADPAERLFHRYEDLLARQGVARHKGEGPRAFGFRAGKALPYQSEAIERFTRAYEAHRYAGAASLDEMRQALALLRKRLPWRRAAPGGAA